MSENTSQKTQIVIAVVGVVGVIAAAALSNWDKLFGTKKESSSASSSSIDLNKIYAQRQSDTDICVFNMRSLSYHRESGYSTTLGVYIDGVRTKLPINAIDFENSTNPYSAKFQVPCSEDYGVNFSWDLAPVAGVDKPSLSAGENNVNFVKPGVVVKHRIPFFPLLEYVIGYSTQL